MFTKKISQENTGSQRRTSRSPQRGPVFSYANSRSVRLNATGRTVDQPVESVHRGRQFLWRKRASAVVALLAIILLAGVLLQLNIRAKVVVSGASEDHIFLRALTVYEQAAQAEFSTFLNRNKLTVDTSVIAENMEKKFPELAVVTVSLPIVGSRPVVYIQPAAPKMILVSTGGMYLLDANGRALITGNQAAKLTQLNIPVVQDQSGLPVTLGKVALPRTAVSFVDEVVEQLRHKKIAIASLALPAGTNELHVRLKGEGYYIKFSLHGSAREEAGTYLATKKYLQKSRITPALYVDVRVENKAYYK